MRGSCKSDVKDSGINANPSASPMFHAGAMTAGYPGLVSNRVGCPQLRGGSCSLLDNGEDPGFTAVRTCGTSIGKSLSVYVRFIDVIVHWRQYVTICGRHGVV